MKTNFDLKGKTALITGASSGLGEQFARTLAAAGARVILAARRIEKLKALQEELGNARALQMDVADKSSVTRCFEELESSGERIDIGVNNAGIAARTPIFEADEEEKFESIIQTNLMGVWYVTQQLARHMKDHGIPGSIIHIASINGEAFPHREATAYAVSKAAVIHMVKALVGELSPYKIRINCISPGLFHTPMTEHRLHNETQRKAFSDKIPLGFVAHPADLDGALLLLASHAHSAYMTGACLTVDGGRSFGASWD